MKKYARVIALVLCLALLAGCGSSDKTFTSGKMTMNVPSYMRDVSDQEDYSGFTFTLDSDQVAIFGLEESYAEYPALEGYSLAEYTDLIIQGNGVEALAIERSGQDYMYFRYTNDTGSGVYKYLAGTFMTEDGFWLIQIAALEGGYDETAFLAYLDSVSFS